MKDHNLTFFLVKISVWKITIYNCSEHNANDQMKKNSSNQEMRFGVFDHAWSTRKMHWIAWWERIVFWLVIVRTQKFRTWNYIFIHTTYI